MNLLKIHYHAASGSAGRPPLLFVHGGYTHAGSWQHYFIPFFNDLGYDCYALDLAGHGQSAGREYLHDFDLSDYSCDLAYAVSCLDQTPVLVGHSMGSLVIERYLCSGAGRALGAALLAPVPPTGTGGSAARLALQEPGFFDELPKAIAGKPTANTLEMMTRLYFSPEMRPEDTEQFMHLICEESDSAIAEMVTMAFRRAVSRPALPVLVLGGSHDDIFQASMLHFTATAWRARVAIVDRAGHMLPLDPQWKTAANILAEWLAPLTANAAEKNEAQFAL